MSLKIEKIKNLQKFSMLAEGLLRLQCIDRNSENDKENILTNSISGTVLFPWFSTHWG